MSSDSKVFMIIGKSFSGKDTFLNKILADDEFCIRNNLYRLVRYTTRKIRPGEIDGLSYYFIDDNDYETNYKDRDDVVITSFDSEFGLLHYITDFSKMESNKNYIVVGDPESIEPYKKVLGYRLCIIYLMPPDWVLMQRFSGRTDNHEYNDLKYKEIHRRFIDDISKFGCGTNRFLANCNCIINVGKDYSLNKLEDCIEKYITIDWNNACFLLTKDETVIASSKYKWNYNSSSSLDQAMHGKILFCNGDIVIYTEDESCVISQNIDNTNILLRIKQI